MSVSANTDQTPTFIKFFPSMSAFGTQGSIVVAMSSGAVLKINADGPLVAASTPTPIAAASNYKVGDGLGAELLRGHRAEVVAVFFPRMQLPMFTLDAAGHLYEWSYADECLSGFGWFVPLKKRRLNLAVTAYQPVGVPKVVFADIKGKDRRNAKKTKADVVAERKAAEAALAVLGLPAAPWHELSDDSGTTRTFAPGPLSGQQAETFHIVTTDAAGTLVQYATQQFQPALNKPARILAAKPSAAQADVVVAALYPAVAPRPAHVSCFLLALPALTFAPLRIDIALSEAEFQECSQRPGSVLFHVTPVVPGSDSDYLLVCMSGRMRAYSLTSGREIRALEAPVKRGPLLAVSSVRRADAPPTLTPRSTWTVPAPCSWSSCWRWPSRRSWGACGWGCWRRCGGAPAIRCRSTACPACSPRIRSAVTPCASRAARWRARSCRTWLRRRWRASSTVHSGPGRGRSWRATSAVCCAPALIFGR